MANQKSKFKTAVVKAKRLYKTGRFAKFSDAVKAAYGKTKTKTKKIGATGKSDYTTERHKNLKTIPTIELMRRHRDYPEDKYINYELERRRRKSAGGGYRTDRKGQPPGSGLAGIRVTKVKRTVTKKIATIGAAKSMITGSLKERLKNVLYKKEMATRKTDRRKLTKQASEIKKDIKRFS